MIITPFNEIGNATTGGTWSYIGSLVSYPTPPASYNGTMDTTAFKSGIYVYKYDVTSGSCSSSITYTLTLKNSKKSFNDECSGATSIATHNLTTIGTTTRTNYYLSDTDYCTNDDAVQAATLSVNTQPTNWNSEPTSDLWYKFSLPQGTTSTFSIAVEVDSTSYGVNPLEDIYVALYTGTCGGLTLVDSVVGNDIVTVPYEIADSNTIPVMYIRIGTVNGGYFNLSIKSYGGTL